jgi:hypothetical protein
MPSEKMRYRWDYPANDALNQSGLPQKARALLAGSSPVVLEPFAGSLLDIDDANIYLLISHCLELNAGEVQLLVEAAIEQAKGREEILMEHDQHVLWRMIVPILARSQHLAEAHRYLEAVEPILVIFVLMEKEVTHVADEGFTLQLLLEDCFTTLHAIAAHTYDSATVQAMKALCRRYNLQRDEDDSYFEDEWNDASDALCRL